jgi:hypothetical protein
MGLAMTGTAATAAAGAVAGALVGYLCDQGVDLESAKDIAKDVDAGCCLVSVTVPSNGVSPTFVAAILAKYGRPESVVLDTPRVTERLSLEPRPS